MLEWKQSRTFISNIILKYSEIAITGSLFSIFLLRTLNTSTRFANHVFKYSNHALNLLRFPHDAHKFMS